MCKFSSGSLYPAIVLVVWGAQPCTHHWNKFSKLLPRELHHESCLDPDQRPSVGQGGFFDFALDWSTGDGLELLRAGEQQDAAQPLCSCPFLGHCSWLEQLEHNSTSLISYLPHKLQARAKFCLCCTKGSKVGWAWRSLQGKESQGMVMRNTRGVRAGGQRGKQSWKMIRVQGTNTLWTLCFSFNQLLVFVSSFSAHINLSLWTGLFQVYFSGFVWVLILCFFFSYLDPFFSVCRLW